jgi:hypothetical protein
LLQPHDLYPMTRGEFDYWVTILRMHVPEHPALRSLGTTFFPRLPEDVEEMRQAHARAHPVGVMKDQDGARRVDPDMRTAMEWLELMKPGDTLVFRRRDGGSLQLAFEGLTYSARCNDHAATVLLDTVGLDGPTLREGIEQYLAGRTEGCVKRLYSKGSWKRQVPVK